MAMTDASNSIARLIDSVKEVNGWSDPVIAERATRAGHQRSKSWVSDIRNNGMSITSDTVHALAAGLGVPVSRVLRAALEAIGLPYGNESNSPEAAIRADPTLSEETKRTLLMLIGESRQRRRPSRRDVVRGINEALGVDLITDDDDDGPVSDGNDKTDPDCK